MCIPIDLVYLERISFTSGWRMCIHIDLVYLERISFTSGCPVSLCLCNISSI